MLDVLVDRPVQRWILLGHRADCRQHRQRCTIGHARQHSRLRRLAAVAQCCREQEQHVVAECVVVTQALFDALAGIGRRRRKRDRRRRDGCALPLPPQQQHHPAQQHPVSHDPSPAHQLRIAVSVAAAAS